MNWLNIKTSQLREPEFIGSDPVARATWICVLAYCCDQENGGRIKGASKWKDRQWQQTCGVTLDEVCASSPLMEWDGDDLLLWSFPNEKQNEVQLKRDVAKENGRLGGRPRLKNKPTLVSTLVPTLKPTENQDPKAEGERKEKGKEVEVEAPATTTFDFVEIKDETGAIPSEDEVIAHGFRSGVPPGFCRDFHDGTTEKKYWLNTRGILVDWRRQLVRFWHSRSATWREPLSLLPQPGTTMPPYQSLLAPEDPRTPAERLRARRAAEEAQ